LVLTKRSKMVDARDISLSYSTRSWTWLALLDIEGKSRIRKEGKGGYGRGEGQWGISFYFVLFKNYFRFL